MRIIKLSQSSLNKDWSMNFMDESHYDTLLNEDVAVYKPDGSPLLVLLKKALDKERIGLAWSVLKGINMKTENRSVASGTPATHRKKLDGSYSSTSRAPKGWEVVSGIVGNFERVIRFPYAHKCAWNLKNPDKFQRLWPMLQETTELFKKHVPDRFAVQKGFVDRTHKDWVIPHTVYTTLTINKNFRTAAHLDAGDLVSGFSNMIVIKEGLIKGGHLVLPNWRLAVELDTYDFIMFDAHEFHGNTQVLPLSKGAVRCSIVCYYREKMVLCKSTEEELSYAKNRRPGDPLFENSLS